VSHTPCRWNVIGQCHTATNVFVFEGDGRRIAVIAAVQTDRPDKSRSLSWQDPRTPWGGARFAAELVLLRIITREITLGTHDARMFALTAIRSAPSERRTRYTRYLKVLAPPSIRKELERLMKTVLKDDFIDGWIEEGLKEGRRDAPGTPGNTVRRACQHP
jgi:hypothetical protein